MANFYTSIAAPANYETDAAATATAATCDQHKQPSNTRPTSKHGRQTCTATMHKQAIQIN